MIDREEMAAIKKRNEVTYRFKQNLTEAEADRAALLDALEAAEALEKRLREAARKMVRLFEDAVDTRRCGIAQLRVLNEVRKALAETAP